MNKDSKQAEYIKKAGGCIVSKNIIEGKGQLKWLIREESTSPVDNGWRFFSDIDTNDYLEDPKKYEANMPWYKDQISNCTYRQFTTGFYFGKPSEESQIYDSNTYIREYTYLGIIGEIKDGLYRIEQRNKFSVGEVIEIMKPDGQNVEATVEKIIDEDGNEQESAPHPKQVLYVALSADASVYDILRRAEKETE